MPNARAVDSLIAFFEALEPRTLARLPDHYAADAYFKDPFNEVHGAAAIQAIFAHMFSQVCEPRFVMRERVVAQNGAMLVWELCYRVKSGKKPSGNRVIRGATHLRFDAGGKVVFHRDYWDAAEELYATLPVLGWLMRALQRKLAAVQQSR